MKKIGFHVTTPRKIKRYEESGCILPPVRFWPNILTAKRWAKRVKRTEILAIYYEESYPLPDHKPAHWTPDVIRHYTKV